MKTTFNALIVPAHLTQPVRIEIVDTEMEALQKLVEGNIESLTSKDWHVYLNDEGSRLPQNVRAEVLAREAGISLDDTLNGTAVFLGHGGRRSESDAPGHLIRLAEQLFDAPLAA
ncbi:DUF3846 domain-containing protein [Pseudarthrobacter sp. H3Y2-7]|uniref:DUF3846 domain-containing protein n=1 Tax=Pseudarthrobacter TaxID=1742993 RepID=UPI0023AFEF79|nr:MULTISPECIES: DUF3846 domain-containing protein [unclassified Pseudarthrobacter]MDE8669587.1 DUF3846 domain-containing protein [Pseudarthrobacter sp. H3Y2-7]